MQVLFYIRHLPSIQLMGMALVTRLTNKTERFSFKSGCGMWLAKLRIKEDLHIMVITVRILA